MCSFLLQTVLNTMCGYGMQQLGELSAGQDVFTIGCLERIVWWAKNNLLLVAGLTAGLLLLEVTPLTGGQVQFTSKNYFLRLSYYLIHKPENFRTVKAAVYSIRSAAGWSNIFVKNNSLLA